MFGKTENGRLVIAGQKIQIENGWITNPTTEDLIANGYKKLEYGAKPDYDKEEEKLVETYQDMGNEIYVGYDKVALTDGEHNAIIQQEIVAEENKITPRNYREAIKDLKAKKETSYALDKIDVVENNIAELRAKIREITPKEEE